jgi:hypothetical protein
MHRALVANSDGLRKAARGAGRSVRLIPAMYGCPDCRTALVIVSPAPLGDCADCGTRMVVLTADEVPVAATA